MLHEHHITVPRTARYYTIGTPGPGTTDLWIACHGYGQLAGEFLSRMQALEGEGRVVVAPEALSRYYLERAQGGSHASSPVGATWMTREDREAEIADQIAYLDRLVEHLTIASAPARPSLTVLGFSQGVATVCRWLAHSKHRATRLICWGGVPPEDTLRGHHTGWLRHAKLYVVTGSRDAYITTDRAAEAARQIEALGLAVSVESFTGGHRLDDETLRRIAAAH